MDGWTMDDRVDEQMNRQMGQMDGWLDGRMGRWIDGWKDGWMDRMGEVAGGWLLGGSSGWRLTPISACCRYLLHISALLPPPWNLLVQVLGLGMLSFDDSTRKPSAGSSLGCLASTLYSCYSPC